MIPSLFIQAAVISTALAAPFPFSIHSRRQAPAACPPSHLIVARGSLESPGPGSMATLAEKIIAANPGTTVESIEYPATIDNYATSSVNGTMATEQQLTAFVQKCPSSKVAMLGFSQGAQVVGDALAGGGIQGVSRLNAPVNRAVSERVAAVVMYGDPRHLVQTSFNVGTATKDGVFPRPMNQSLNAFADKTKSFCNVNDPFCASGDDLAVHLAYPPQFDAQAAEFVTAKFQGTAVLGSSNSNSTNVAFSGKALNSTTASTEKARSVVVPWSNANFLIFSKNKAGGNSSSSSLARKSSSSGLKPRSPWAFAELRFERQRVNGTSAAVNSTRVVEMRPL